jgi:alkylated DNA repair dioxygenase AlkB
VVQHFLGDDALFAMPTPGAADLDVTADLDRTGGVPVAVDHAFGTVERIHLDETSWVDHVHGWLAGDAALVALLTSGSTWEQRSRWMYTRTVVEPRLTAEHPVVADAPHPVLPYLADVLSGHYRRAFTRLWMNWYRDQEDSTGWHADRPADQQPEAVIPVLSLGAPRRFLLRHVEGGPVTTFHAHGGDLVVMGGRTQRDFRHCVPRERTPSGTRLSLNFSVAPPV